jgi:ribosomal protein S18 acetylase RimI-like enzyme
MSVVVQNVVKIRPATPADVQVVGQWGADLVALHHEFDAGRFVPSGATTPATYGAFLESQLRRPEVIVLVAEDETSLLGYVYAAYEGSDYMTLRGPAGVMHDIFVDPARRGQGVGRLLLETVIQDLTVKGARLFVLSTAYRNQAAQRLFAAVGFRPTMIEMTYGPNQSRPE